MEIIKLIGWFMIAIGLAIRYVVARRRFNRRGVGGLQHFSSFEKGLFYTFVERFFSLLAFLILLGGVLILIFYYSIRNSERKEERKIQETEVVYNGLKLVESIDGGDLS